MDYKAPDNIYWLFSSSAQAIAAFIGFVAGGFFFSYQGIDKQVENDETVVDIIAEIKTQYYNRLKTLFYLTGLSIFFSLLIVYLNAFNLGWINATLQILTTLLNLLTISWAIGFVISIIDPNKIKRTAAKLVRQNKHAFPDRDENSIDTMDYVSRFIGLEQTLRRLAATHPIYTGQTNFLPVTNIIKGLYQQKVITEMQLKKLTEVIKIRNLAVHSGVERVAAEFAAMVDELRRQMGTQEED